MRLNVRDSYASLGISIPTVDLLHVIGVIFRVGNPRDKDEFLLALTVS